uniref:Uncharacterized protein n=1 Tax=Tanacetum cinerariifolium TaxID=118510 RepID=A0A6L2M3M6_TANCI|nr:hypothetical protein [Tanacetum cinerariifolium]
MKHSNNTLAKIPILDTRKFKQWKFRIQRNNDKARNTLLLALPDEHQLRFSKYKTAQELWAAILKTFGGNEATKKTKKNLLKQQYGNFKAEGKKTLEQTFNRLHAIVSQLESMDVEIKQDDLNQKLLTSLSPEWLMHTIVWRNRSDLDTMSLDDLYNHLKVYESEVKKKSESNSQNMAFISLAKHSSRNEEVNTASVSTASTNVSPTSANIGAASISQDTACAYIAFQSSGKKISIQGTDMAGFDKSKVECFNCHKMGHFVRECRAPRSQDRGRRDNYRQESKVEEQNLKALMVIDGVGWDWSFMANEQEDHAFVADEEAPTEFALMAKTSADSEVFDNSLCSKNCKKNTESLNSKITYLTNKLCDGKNMLFHYKAGLSHVEGRLVEFKNQEIKFCKKIRVLEFNIEGKSNRIEYLTKELENLKNEKEGLESKLTGFQSASKDLDSFLKSQRLDKNLEGLGYSAVPPPAQVYSPPKKDLSWTGIPEFADDTVIDYSRPSPAKESTSDDAQNRNPSVPEIEASPSTISSKPFIKFVKAADPPTVAKSDKKRNLRSQFRGPRVATVNRKFPTVKRKLPTVNRKFPTGNTKFSIADLGNKGKAGNSQNHIDDKGYWDSGCSRHMTGNISYHTDYEPYDGGYVSFGQGGCKIIGKGTIKIGKLDFENVYFVKELKTPRQHNMYTIDLNNIVPHKDLTCLVAKASTDEGMLWHRRLGKQHKVSCKTKLVNSMTKHLHILHMDLFGSTSDETSGILRNFITEIENLKELRVKIIRCDNGDEFRNKEMNDFCSRKGIKKEFSNARTPQQNGVAERRNRTLIEAARTMLADAKLPVTFWAGSVNTAFYIQNRVLVNKSQNKTLYELFNGRSPAIGFLKPFGCYVMILNSLDNLGKFETKRDKGYFLGYSMSNKAFRVFNKRTKRVEENLHVDFLENKPIEKGAGPNWLFDIDSLTNSINYVTMVVEGTNSTNFSGTKEAAGQDVKKDVSSLRYIVLPTWFHEAPLESSTSNAQDTCSAAAPGSSRNSNPTATSTNPSANHMETLAVETLIPTISSPVPTTCLNDSPEPSGDTRLISKRVTSQDDTPSLDNILSLTNRFEDILRVTTNTNDTNGVEADLGNMETTITASPTPTLRIHKDHPKNQIIEPKKVSDALQDPSWVRPIGTKWVLKNKKDERGIVIKNKARLVAQGHTQEEGIDYDEVFAPVARIKAIRLFLPYALFMRFTVYQMDMKSAFLYGTIDKEVYVMQPPGF